MSDQIYVSDIEAKNAICEFGKRLYARGLTGGNEGNLSYKVGDNAVWVTPTMESKGYLTPDMLLKLDFDGNILNKSEYKISSESKMHLGILKANPMLQCVIHAHPIHATALAIVGEKVDATLLPESMVLYGDSINVTEYATPGTNEVPESILPYCKGTTAVLIGNHGAIAGGRTMKEAYFSIETLENYCHIYTLVNYQIGKCKRIPEEKANLIRQARKQLLGL